MKAMVLNKVCDLAREHSPLTLVDLPIPKPGADQILVKVLCCGVCHTELDEIEGRAMPAKFPVILGHQAIGTVAETGSATHLFIPGQRVGIAWIFSACGECKYCINGLENLCSSFQATGLHAPGGYAQYMVVNENFAHPIPEIFSNAEAAPLLCAGAIGYRSLRLADIRNGETLGLTGFGASGHLVLKMARYLFPDSKIIVFARNAQEQDFARSLGASWAGDIDQSPPFHANAIIDTTPAWNPVVKSLGNLSPGGRLVINAIRKEATDKNSILNLDYKSHLWLEKEIKSVANITRNDVREFLGVASNIPIKPEVELYDFADANIALLDLKHGHIKGAKVLVMEEA
jgi:propanol-preferring alcohol dehydrogenase